MSVLLFLAGAGTAGYRIGRWWVAGAVVVFGTAVAMIVQVAGGSLNDTPIPFAVASGVLAATLGLVFRRRVSPG